MLLCPLLAPRSGSNNLGRSLSSPFRRFGESGGFLASTRGRIRWEASSGNWKESLLPLSKEQASDSLLISLLPPNKSWLGSSVEKPSLTKVDLHDYIYSTSYL